MHKVSAAHSRGSVTPEEPWGRPSALRCSTNSTPTSRTPPWCCWISMECPRTVIVWLTAPGIAAKAVSTSEIRELVRLESTSLAASVGTPTKAMVTTAGRNRAATRNRPLRCGSIPRCAKGKWWGAYRQTAVPPVRGSAAVWYRPGRGRGHHSRTTSGLNQTVNRPNITIASTAPA